MKKSQFILTTIFILLLTNHAFSQTMEFMATASEGGQNAVYNDVSRDKTVNIITLFKPNGEVVKDFDLYKYYEGVTSQKEMDELTDNILGYEVAIISINKENNLLILSIGTIAKSKEIFNITTRSECDLDSTNKISIFDMQKMTAIYMHNN